MNRAYHVARPGAVVQVAGGTYSSPTFQHDTAKDQAKRNVVLRPAKGASVTVRGTMLFKSAHITIDGFHFTGYGRPTTNADGFAMKFDGQNCVTHHIVVKNSTAVNSPAFMVLNGSHDITLSHDNFGDYGFPGVDQSDADIAGTWTQTCGGRRAPNAYNILLDHTAMHDVYWKVPQSQWGGAHPDCMELDGQTGDPKNPRKITIRIRNSVFFHCGNSFLMIGANNLTSYGLDCCNSYGVLVEGNLFWGLGDDSYFGIQIVNHEQYECGGYIFTRNTYVPNNPHGLEPDSPIRVECRGGRVEVSRNLFQRGPGQYLCSSFSPFSVWTQNLFVNGSGCGATRAGMPYGYQFTDRALRPSTGAAPVVRKVFKLAAAGVPLSRIPRAVRKAGLTLPASLRGATSLRHLLQNRVYLGSLYGRPRAHPALVSRGVWRRVQARLG